MRKTEVFSIWTCWMHPMHRNILDCNRILCAVNAHISQIAIYRLNILIYSFQWAPIVTVRCILLWPARIQRNHLQFMLFMWWNGKWQLHTDNHHCNIDISIIIRQLQQKCEEVAMNTDEIVMERGKAGWSVWEARKIVKSR